MPALIGLLQLLGVGLLAVVLFAAWHAAWSLVHPPRRTYGFAVARNIPGDPGELDPPREYEVFTVRGKHHELPVWRIPGDNPTGPTVVLAHGWGSSRLGSLKRLPSILPHARAVLAIDLPGHGEAPGISRLGTSEHEDIIALAQTIEDGPVVLYGWSLGAGVVLAAAATRQIDKLQRVVCEAPYRRAITPARNVIRLRGIPHTLNLPISFAGLGMLFGIGPAWRGFDRELLASNIGDLPLTVFHGTDDPVCPIDDGRAIAEAAAIAEFIAIEGGGHNNLWTDPRFAEQAGAILARAVASSDADAT